MQVLGNVNALEVLSSAPRPMTVTFLRMGGGGGGGGGGALQMAPAYAVPAMPMPPPMPSPTYHAFTVAAPGSLGLQLNFAPGPIPGAPPGWTVAGFNPDVPCLVPGACVGDVLCESAARYTHSTWPYHTNAPSHPPSTLHPPTRSYNRLCEQRGCHWQRAGHCAAGRAPPGPRLCALQRPPRGALSGRPHAARPRHPRPGHALRRGAKRARAGRQCLFT